MSSPESLSSRLNYFRQVPQILLGMDWYLAAATSFLVAVGLSTLKYAGQGGMFYDRQLEFLWVGVAALVIFWRIPYVFWTQKVVVPVLYGINLALLLAVMMRGHAALGAQRWLALGPITLQPSEIAKMVVIFTLAAWFRSNPIRSFFDIFKALFIMLPPAVLVFKQPDLGTSLTFGAVFLAMIFWSGATVVDIVVLASPVVSLVLNAISVNAWLIFVGVLGTVLAISWRRRSWSLLLRLAMCAVVVTANIGVGELRPHLWGMLKDYQQKRLTSFVNPWEDPRGSGYHILQSLIAIGSGGLEGSGLGHGNQSQGEFIPERHTDFIFAVIGEELGFRISCLVILSYVIICARALVIAYQSRQEPSGSFVAIGIMALFLFHVFLNIGMTMGIMPVAGVPLPFMSYGGTALIIDLICIGLLLSVSSMHPAPREDVWK